MASYLFGDTDVAAKRLRLVAEVYAESTRAFLYARGAARSDAAVDLGCGLGYTTHLIAEALDAVRVVGVDTSERFIALAQQTATGTVTFASHDVTQLPLPACPSTLIFCRLLLTHMREPQQLLAQWATQLQPHGMLMLEEVESIRTNSPVFSTYLEMQRALLVHQDNQLYIGPVLDALPVPALLRKRTSDVRAVPVAPARAAAMFAMNFPSWKQHPFIQQQYDADMIQHIEEQLQHISETPDAQVEIEWGMRQLVYERT